MRRAHTVPRDGYSFQQQIRALLPDGLDPFGFGRRFEASRLHLPGLLITAPMCRAWLANRHIEFRYVSPISSPRLNFTERVTHQRVQKALDP